MTRHSFFARAFSRRGMPLWVDCVIAAAIFTGGAVWGTSYWQRTAGRGQPSDQPYYYQPYFEPAVMVACGKGYVVARPQIPAMVAFLQRQVDTFPCTAIPADARLGTDGLFQLGSWRYLLETVGLTWRVVGVSWSALGPLFGLMFGATLTSAYAVFRLGLSPIVALGATEALRHSVMQLKYLGNLRDYTTAPFTLALIAILGALVIGRFTWKRALVAAGLYGAVLGIGYGFRTDSIIDIPPFLMVLFLFVPGDVRRNLRIKIAAAAVAAAVFTMSAWPVISTLDRTKPGCLWHVMVLGFAKQFDPVLGIEPAPYEVAREYLDEWAYTTVSSYGGRVHPGIGHLEYCEAAHGAVARTYLKQLAVTFPADLVIRAYASILRVVELPFSPVPGIDDDNGRQPDWNAGHGVGLLLVLAAVLAIGTVNLRLGIFVVIFVLYFAAIPAIQFDHRHFFYLEFMTWWAGGFLVQAAITDVRPLLSVQDGGLARRFGRFATIVGACLALMIAVLWAARVYQQPRVAAAVEGYLTAAREQIPPDRVWSPSPGLRIAPHTDPETADLLMVAVNGSACASAATVDFSYDDPARRAYGRTFALADSARAPGLTYILMPVYDGFGRIEMSDASSGCIDAVFRVRNPQQFSLLPEVILPPGWRHRPLYQRLAARVF